MPSLRDVAEWVVKRISALTRTATSADLTDSEYMAVDDASAYTRKITVASLATWILGKIKSLATSITAFRTGDVIPVDGPSGSAKMSKDDLLRVTAENALAGNVAPAFDSNKPNEADGYAYHIGEYVTYSGDGYNPQGVYQFVKNHASGIWVLGEAVKVPISYPIEAINDRIYNEADIMLTATATQSGKYLDGNGAEQSNAAYTLDTFSVDGIKSVRIRCRLSSSAYIWFYDGNGYKVIGFYGNGNVGINFEHEVEIPANVTSFKVSYVTSFGAEVYVPKGIVPNVDYSVNYSFNANAQQGPVLKKTTEGYYLNSSGVEISLASLNINDYDVNGIDKVCVKARIVSSTYLWFYDKSGTRLSGDYGNSSGGVNYIKYLDVPSGAVLLRVSYVSSFGCVVFSKTSKEQTDAIVNSSLIGRKIGIIGDSIAAGASAGSVDKRFINIAARNLGAVVDNRAIGGWQFCDSGNTGVYRQVADLDNDDDLILILAGTNDFGHGEAIGDVYTTGVDGRRTATTSDYATTTCGGIHKAIEAIYIKYGYRPIVLCTPIQRKLNGNHSEGGSWDVNDAGKYLVDYANAIKAVAEYWGIPVFDAFSINMQPMVDVADSDYFDDGLHPNDAGHRLLGNSLARYMSSIWIDDTAHSPSP